MIKRKTIKKYNAPIYLYWDGGIIGEIGTAASSILGTGISNSQIADTSLIENNIQSPIIGANDNSSLMSEWGAWSPMENINSKDIRGGSTGTRLVNTLGALGSGATAGASIGGPLGAIIGAGAGLISGISGWISGDKKAREKAEKLNKQINYANENALLSFQNRANTIDTQNDLLALANYAAKGGKIYTKNKIANNLFQNGGDKARRVDFSKYVPKFDRSFIPENMEQLQDSLIARGFKEPQRVAIMSNILHESGGDPNAISASGKFSGIAQWSKDRYPESEDLAAQIHRLMVESTTPKSPAWSDGGGGIPYIRDLKHGYDSFWNATDPYNATLYYTKGLIRPQDEKARINRANEASYMFEHLKSKGGPLYNQHGGIFSNNVITIGNGGTHEQNPFEGVQIGTDPQGIPNMVEEGEVIWNNYVFSNRLKPTKEFKNKYKVKGTTFADVAKEVQKESEERPNDPISKRGLDDLMTKLQIEQETMRVKNDNSNYAKGGRLVKLYEGDGTDPNLLNLGDSNEISRITPLLDEINFKTPTLLRLPLTSPNEYARNAYNRLNYRESEFQKDAPYNSWLRYAPVAGSALGVIENLFSKPDYSNSNLIVDAANKAGQYTPIQYTPISNYLRYTPLDKNYYLNKLEAQAGATRRAIVNQSAGNRATALAGLLAADYNAQEKSGDLIRQAEEFNLAQRQAVEQFNRATNQANSEMGLQASRYNQAARQAANEARLKGISQAISLRENQDQQRAAARSANITSLFDNLGAVGKENYIMEMIKNNPSLLYDWMGKYKKDGGYLTIKNNKRRK